MLHIYSENDTQQQRLHCGRVPSGNVGALGGKHLFCSTLKNWIDRFRTEHFITEDIERFGRPPQVMVPGKWM
jgi:hypothetical protein